jgi:polyhydroxyalkanoate synthase
MSECPPKEMSWNDWVRALDRQVHGDIGQLMSGISPIQTTLVYLDWISHLLISPGKQLDLVKQTAEDLSAVAANPASRQRVDDAQGRPSSTPDRRFAGEGWQQWPFHAYAQGFHIMEQAWHRATHGVPGLNHRHEEIAAFAARQWLDVFNPANIPWLNPDVIATTAREGGMNLMRGAVNWADDLQRMVRDLPPAGAEAFKPGDNVAITPGRVVFRNDLIELIQYSPATGTVHPEPVLLVPAWIMKYYILDLSPHNSLVKHLVGQGHTVFMISWKNPTKEDRCKGLDDYRVNGVMAALETIGRIVPGKKVHATGYCLGGTLLMIAAATMGRDKDDRLASMTLFAAQGDFTEAGELLMFINESEVELIESMMAQQGYLKGSQMAGAFQLLHSDDLIWSRALKNYMLGQRDSTNDLMAWNADTTRLPYRMHSEYLHKLFLHNDLAGGRYEVDGHPIWFTDIHVPCFAVGTVSDHVAPWKSVFKLHLLPLDITFVLTSGGHNAGILSEPGHRGRHFQVHHRPPTEAYLAPERWQAQVPHIEGSWWPTWQAWLASHSGPKQAPPPMGAPGSKQKLPDAPGHYVKQD